MRTLLLALIQTAVGFDLPLVATLTAMIAAPVKFLVDVVKGAAPKLPSSSLPAVGLVLGFLFALVVLTAVKVPFDASVFAQCGIAAVGAQVAAMAMTWNQTRADRVDEKIEKALASDSGTTRAEIDAEVKKDASK